MLTLRQLKKIQTPWIGISKDIDLSQYAGFIYLITELSSRRMYLGKKVFWFKRRKKVKGRKNRKKVTSESDWQYYKGSSEELLQRIREQGIEGYEFRLIKLCPTRSSLNYEEVKELFQREVLHKLLPSGEYAYFNYCIGGKWYRGKV